MKTTLKKTMAALSAAAVVAASAAVMAVPASAVDTNVITWSSVTLTLDELKAANYEVTLTASSSQDWLTLSFGAQIDDAGLTLVEATWPGSVAAEKDGAIWYAGATSTAYKAGATGAAVTVKVTEDAQPGDTFTVTGLSTSPAGVEASYKDSNKENGSATVTSGTITIAEEETEAPTTTEAEAEATEAAETTTTEAAAVATKTTASSTSSPKTGDALPVAGVAAAVAVIGGVALVSKKRK
jgi:LPXTG-motif cell wall-anchored protein